MAPDALGRACAGLSVTDPVPVASTPRSHVFRVRRPDGTAAALKLLTGEGAEERAGARMMAWRDGRGTARILGREEDAILVEWLDGPSLGDLARNGEVGQVIDAIAGLLPRLHAPIESPCPPLVPLNERFAALFALPPDRVSPGMRPAMSAAMSAARRCLDEAGPPVPLHGDLHHDNVLGSVRGWMAIDAKGVLGCRGYEVANLFGNPADAPHLITDPAYHTALAHRFATVLDLPERRIREWAVAHMALGLVWAMDDGDPVAPDWTRVLPLLLAGIETAPV